MANCIREANILPKDIDVVNCHATSTDVGDLAELNAIKYLFGNKDFENEHNFNNCVDSCEYFKSSFVNNENLLDITRLSQIKLDGNKAQIGHLLAGAGAVESIFSIMTIYDVINSLKIFLIK